MHNLLIITGEYMIPNALEFTRSKVNTTFWYHLFKTDSTLYLNNY